MIKLSKYLTEPEGRLSREKAEAHLEEFRKKMFSLQNLLYANQKNSLLIVLQGMDASGKDGTIRHVFSGLNPQGCNVHAFKAPTIEEHKHDFLWRVYPHLPAKGMITIFNRSHYEDVLYPVVHKEIDSTTVLRRYETINQFERNLQDSGTIILKFFLHISKKEQLTRIRDRLTSPTHRWKYDPADTQEAKKWKEYQSAYEALLSACAKHGQWNIVPADRKWYRNHVVAKKIVDALEGLKMKYPS